METLERKLIKRIKSWRTILSHVREKVMPLAGMILLILVVADYLFNDFENAVLYFLITAGIIFAIILVFIIRGELEGRWGRHVQGIIGSYTNKNLKLSDLGREIFKKENEILRKEDDPGAVAKIYWRLKQDYAKIEKICQEKIVILENIIEIREFAEKNKVEIDAMNYSWNSIEDINKTKLEILTDIKRMGIKMNQVDGMILKLNSVKSS